MNGATNAGLDAAMRLYREARFPEALERFEALLAAEPAAAGVRSMRGMTLAHMGDFERGIADLGAAVQIAPRDPVLRTRLGMILFVMDELPGALAALRQALVLSPGQPDALSNLSLVLKSMGDFAGAERAARKALAARPGFLEARINLAGALLSQGKFAEGWPAYCARPDAPVNPRDPALAVTVAHESALPAPPAPVILHGEQGLGDALFFLRFAPLLRARGHPLAFWGDTRLHALLARTGQFAHFLKPESVPGPGIAVVWVGDLPRLLAMDDPAAFPPPLALTTDPARRESLRARFAQWGEPPWIGLSWRAGLERRGKVALAKEIEPGKLGAVLSGARATWISLQRGAREGELAALGAAIGVPVHDAGFANADLEDALAATDLLDDYVAVSNTNVHLRAGTGKPARVLVPWPPEWRWSGADGRSPWFASAAVYRQAPAGDWEAAFARLAADLAAYNPRSR